MNKIAFFDTKPYDLIWFDKLKTKYNIDIKYIDSNLTIDSINMAEGTKAVVVFVNDNIDEEILKALSKIGISLIALRCAGYNNVDLEAAKKYGIKIVRVPAYSPHAVAEFAIGLLFCSTRKIHKAYLRTKNFDFSIDGLTGFDLYQKTVGVIGTGKIGRVFIDICKGLGMNILAYDPYPIENSSINYVSLDELFSQSDIISLHCPLDKSTFKLINKDSLSIMKDGVTIINTSRGALIDTESLIEAIKTNKVGATALDVYEEESEYFYEDFSNKIIDDDTLARLVSLPNVIITSHQAFLTNEALENIADITLKNIDDYFNNKELENEIV